MLSESFVLAFAMSLDADAEADEDDGVLVVFMPSNTEVRGCVSVVSLGFGFEGASSVAYPNL